MDMCDIMDEQCIPALSGQKDHDEQSLRRVKEFDPLEK